MNFYGHHIIDEKRTISDVKRAFKDFEEALNKDEILREIYEYILGKEIISRYGHSETRQFKKEFVKNNIETYNREELPKSTERANESLRRVANHLSLSFLLSSRYNYSWEI